jgi:hypothetical protein
MPQNLASSGHDLIRACSLQDATHNIQELHRVTHLSAPENGHHQASLNPDALNPRNPSAEQQ